MPKKPTSKKIYLGLDPGKQGGAAIVSDDGVESYYQFTEDYVGIWRYISESKIEFGMMEKNRTRPNEGPVGAWTFGWGHGILWAWLVAADIPREEVSPQLWQKGLRFKARDKKKESYKDFKERLRLHAQQLFPKLELWSGTLTKQRAVCDAILIAEYCRRAREGNLH